MWSQGGIAGYVVYGGGRHEEPGRIHPRPSPAAVLAARAAAQGAARAAFTPAPPARQILFGDLHVHTTFSADAFMRSLPFLQGEGAHPPADACDYARFCSGLDFFALTDHAESLTPRHWRESIDSIRQCNATAGDPRDPDLVAYVGFEWSQVGATPEEHYGHKNVILRGLADDELSRRPIAAPGLVGSALRGLGMSRWKALQVPLRDFSHRQRYLDLRVFNQELAAVPDCPAGVDTRSLPADCRETATTPRELYEKLAQWGVPSMVIPHGSTWGFYTPPGYRWDKQLAPGQRDPDRTRLVEVYSGHGNSEEYRPWDDVERGPDGAQRCPAPTADHEACCWRAGEIIRSRCGDAPTAECEARVATARASYVAAGVAGHLTVPGASVEDWKDCGQCRDCFAPSFSFRPGGSVQYMLARGDFTDPAAPYHERLGLIASSDNRVPRTLARARAWSTRGSGSWRHRRLPRTHRRTARQVGPGVQHEASLAGLHDRVDHGDQGRDRDGVVDVDHRLVVRAELVGRERGPVGRDQGGAIEGPVGHGHRAEAVMVEAVAAHRDRAGVDVDAAVGGDADRIAERDRAADVDGQRRGAAAAGDRDQRVGAVVGGLDQPDRRRAAVGDQDGARGRRGAGPREGEHLEALVLAVAPAHGARPGHVRASAGADLLATGVVEHARRQVGAEQPGHRRAQPRGPGRCVVVGRLDLPWHPDQHAAVERVRGQRADPGGAVGADRHEHPRTVERDGLRRRRQRVATGELGRDRGGDGGDGRGPVRRGDRGRGLATARGQQ